MDDMNRLTTKLCNSCLVLISVARHGVRPIRTKPICVKKLSLGKYGIIGHIELHSFVGSLLVIVQVLTVRCNIIHKCRVITSVFNVLQLQTCRLLTCCTVN